MGTLGAYRGIGGSHWVPTGKYVVASTTFRIAPSFLLAPAFPHHEACESSMGVHGAPKGLSVVQLGLHRGLAGGQLGRPLCDVY